MMKFQKLCTIRRHPIYLTIIQAYISYLYWVGNLGRSIFLADKIPIAVAYYLLFPLVLLFLIKEQYWPVGHKVVILDLQITVVLVEHIPTVIMAHIIIMVIMAQFMVIIMAQFMAIILQIVIMAGHITVIKLQIVIRVIDHIMVIIFQLVIDYQNEVDHPVLHESRVAGLHVL